MIHFADPRLGRKFILSTLAAVLLVCLAAGGVTWYALGCNVLDYLDRASPNPLNSYDRYLFACGYVWHSLDGGFRWERVDSRGLPFGARDGFIAVDRTRGHLYLGILINTSSSVQCWDCAWKSLRPAIYLSTDGGNTWAFAYKFRRGPAGSNNFVGLYVDPGKEGYVYAVIKNVDEITFYASGTDGRFWKATCQEYYDVGRTCQLPESVMQFQTEYSQTDAK